MPNLSYDQIVARRRQATMATYKLLNPIMTKPTDSSSYIEIQAGNQPYTVQTFGAGRITTPITGFGTPEVPPEIPISEPQNLYGLFTYSSNPVELYNADGSLYTTLANSGNSDVGVVKYNSAGAIQWCAIIGGTSGEITNSIQVDASENIYVSGYYFSSILSIYNSDSTLFGTLSNTNTSQDTYIVKYTSSGTVSWATRVGGTSTEDNVYITSDNNGNCYALGRYTSNPVNIYNSDTTLYGTLANAIISSSDTYFIKYDNTGMVVWATRILGAGSEATFSITRDINENIYLYLTTASTSLIIYNSDATQTLGPLTNPSSLSTGVIIKYNSNGFAQQYIKSVATSGSNIVPQSINVDSNGYIYTCGYFSGNVDFYSSNNVILTRLTSGGSSDGYIASYSPAGICVWAVRIGGTGADQLSGISVTADGYIYIGGYFASTTLTLNSTNATTTTLTNRGSGTNDSFIAKYSSSGIVSWAINMGTSSGADICQGVCTDRDGNVYASGYYTGTLPIYNSNGTLSGLSLISMGSIDNYVIKYDTNGNALWAANIGGTSNETSMRVATPYFL